MCPTIALHSAKKQPHRSVSRAKPERLITSTQLGARTADIRRSGRTGFDNDHGGGFVDGGGGGDARLHDGAHLSKATKQKNKMPNANNQLCEKTYAIGAGDGDVSAAVAVEGLGAGDGGQLADCVDGDCADDAVGGDAGGAGGGGVGAWFEGCGEGEGGSGF